MLCIYCRERQADAREHPLPQALGGFLNYEPLLDRLCQPCNEEISKAEQEFARLSPEAVLRSTKWVKRAGERLAVVRAPSCRGRLAEDTYGFMRVTPSLATSFSGSRTRYPAASNLCPNS